MALNIFKVDKSNAVEGEASERSEVVGRFRAGYQVGNRPVGLEQFRVTSSDPEVLEALGRSLGYSDDHAQQAEQWDTKTEEAWEIFTAASSVDIIVDGPGAIQASFVWWGQDGTKIVETDGTYEIVDGKVTDVECRWTSGKTLKEILAQHRAKKGPGPSLAVYFTIEGAEDLGKFRFYSSSGTAIEAFGDEAARLEGLEGPQRYRLALQKVEFTNKEGQEVRYTKPVLTYLGEAS